MPQFSHPTSIAGAGAGVDEGSFDEIRPPLDALAFALYSGNSGIAAVHERCALFSAERAGRADAHPGAPGRP